MFDFILEKYDTSGEFFYFLQILELSRYLHILHGPER